MPIQIDRMDTTIEITPSGGTRSGGDRPAASPRDPAARTALTELFGEVMRDELVNFLRNRGLD
jgi:hypothetical protein